MRSLLRLLVPTIVGILGINLLYMAKTGFPSYHPFIWFVSAATALWLCYAAIADWKRTRGALREIQNRFKDDVPRRAYIPYEAPDLAPFAVDTQAVVRSLRERLREGSLEQTLLRSLLNGLREGVLCVDREGRIVFCNDAMPTTLVEPGATGQPYWTHVREPELLEFLRVLRQPRVEHPPEVRDLRIRDRFYVVHGVPIADGGAAEWFLLIVYDRTEERRTQAMREDFLQNASHELRTPLTSIRGYTETLLARSPESQSKSFLEAVLRNTERMERLVEDMSTISSMETRMTVVRPEKLELPVFLSRLTELVKGVLSRKNLELDIDVPNDASIEADPILLEHLFLNLIDNAARYSPPGERIQVQVRTESEGRILFQVADRGPGVDESIRERIFERFFRADPNRSREAGGTGLGLSIVRHIALLHQGRVWVEGRDGGGAVFCVRLPGNQPKRPRM